MNTTPSPRRWGRDGCAAAVSITFDNLGEAVELERGTWPKDRPLGQHPSVTRNLPAILKLLAELDLSATFFVEGLNVELYPHALKEIVAAGHEVGYHAWRHEEWQHLTYEQEAQILERGVHALGTLSIRPSGFRPPGGALTASSVDLLKKMGFSYCSPAGALAAVSDGLVLLPFAWPIVDAYAYLPRFSSHRERLGDTREPLPPTHFSKTVRMALQKSVQTGGYLCLLFHPFLEESKEHFEVMRSLLEELQRLVQDGSVWCAPCHTIADWMLRHPADFADGTSLDTAT